MEWNFDQERAKGLKSLTRMQFAAVTWMFTCSGPWGFSPMIRHGGPMLTVIGYFVSTLIFIIPQALMSAEMGSMIPTNYGYIAWVYRAWGDIPGYASSVNSVIGFIIDMALYPLFVAAHINQATGNTLTDTDIYLIKIAVVILAMLISFVQMNRVGVTTVVIMTVTSIPILIASLTRLPYFDPATQWSYGPPPGTANPASLLTFLLTLLWMQNGWDAVGTFAGELNFDLAEMGLAFFTTLAMNFVLGWFPFFMALTFPYDPSEWQNGYMSIALGKMLGSGADKMFSALLSLLIFWLYLVMIAAHSRAIMTMAHDTLEIKLKTETIGDESERKETYMIIPVKSLPSIFGHTSPTTGAPIPAAILISVIVASMCFLNFSQLINIDFALGSVAYILKFSAFLKLRLDEPDALRPFTVPGGFIVACMMMGSVVAMSIFIIVVSTIFVPWAGGTVLLFNVIIILLRYNFWPNLKVSYVEKFQKIVPGDQLPSEVDPLLGIEV